MNTLSAILLGALQGLTEFLPVSSSGHLVLAEHWLKLDVTNLLSFDIIVHTGTLAALIIYFWKTWIEILHEVFIQKKIVDSLLAKLVVATIPAVIVALFLKDALETTLRDVTPVLIALLVTAVFLLLGELIGKKQNEKISYKQVMVMGIMQALAIIPGISRSGSTITGGMFTNLTRESAARFAFLMAVPAIAGAFVFSLKEYIFGGMSLPTFSVSVAGFISSFLISLLCIHYFLKFVRKHPLYIFSIYLITVALIGLFI